MLVVLLIIGLMFSLALPSFRSLAKPSPQSVARDVLNMTQVTRLAALRSGTRQALFIDAERRTIRSEANSQQVDIPNAMELSAIFGRSSTDRSREGSITFFPDGGATGGEIRFVEQGGTAAIVSVNWLTGVASLSEVADHD